MATSSIPGGERGSAPRDDAADAADILPDQLVADPFATNAAGRRLASDDQDDVQGPTDGDDPDRGDVERG